MRYTTKKARRLPGTFRHGYYVPQEDPDNLMACGAGAAPDIIYARGVPADPSPEIDSFNSSGCSLILFEIGLCRDLGCQNKLRKKNDNYNPLVTTLRRYWGRIDLARMHPHRPRRHNP